MKEESPNYYLEGMAVPETPLPGEQPKPWAKTSVVGQPIPRIDGYERVSGTAVYTADLVLPDMLYGAILGCPHPHAVVQKIDTSRAEKLPGVRAVICGATKGADVPWNYSRSGPAVKLFDPDCRFEGEAVAAVAAETPYQARDALRAIEVEYAIRPHVSDERDASKPDKPAPPYVRGGIEKGFAEAEVVLEEAYRTECELHTPMEAHAAAARWDGDALTVWESTQGVYAIQATVARTLKLPLSKVRVIGHYMGGGFGSKLQAGKYTIIAAILARQAARPVKLVLSREESLLTVGNRPAGQHDPQGRRNKGRPSHGP